MRVYNFSPGPAVLPEAVLKKAAGEMLDYNNTGMSVMEMSHRSKAYLEIIQEAEKLLRDLMDIPDNYKVLFMQGGASTQFSAVPLNLYNKGTADYIDTGQWSSKAIEEGKRYIDIKVLASSKDKDYSYIPKIDASQYNNGADYLHFTINNTIFGTRYTKLPATTAPLVTDMSSSILSEVYDVSKFGLIYAGAQKNIGPSGVTVVIVRDDLIGKEMPHTPTMLKYKIHADQGSLYNTPPSYAIYIAKLVFEWVKAEGGVAAIQKRNEEKAKMLYDCIDGSSYYKSGVNPEDRSIMNVLFGTGSEEQDKKFIKEAEAEGLVTLAGYRTIGGMRASIYNAMPVDGIIKLVKFMEKFELENKG